MIDPATKSILKLVAAAALLVTAYLWAYDRGEKAADARHAATFQRIAELTAVAAEKAGRARALFADQVLADVARHAKETEDAYEAGRAAAAGIADGSVRVRTVWRDRECSAAVPGPGAEPAGGDPAVSGGRADAIGRVLGRGWGWDATYGLAYSRLTRAQELLDACYEQPSTGHRAAE